MAHLEPQEFERRAMELEWLLCDVDGVLTGGGLYYDRRGHQLLRFNVKDGLGLKLAQQAGLKVGLLSGRTSGAVDRRAAELGLDLSLTGAADKSAVFDDFLERHQIEPLRVAFIGDDLPDLKVLGRCGLAFAPADAVAEVQAVVHQVLTARGGAGAAREAVEAILRARGSWQQSFARFTFEG
jgi:3-deoxy-D-manno-octulosonate 8-phosphate phosphatase (KDO 8-P phosphatase)